MSQGVRGAPLHQLDQSVNAKLRVHFHQEMNVVRHDLQLKDLRTVFMGDLAKDLLEVAINALAKNWAPIFRAPHHVVLARVDNIVV